MVKFYFKPLLKRKKNIKAKRLSFRHSRESIRFRISAIALSVLLLVVFGEAQLRPIIKNAGAKALKNELTLLLNKSVNDALKKCDTDYCKFIIVKYNKEGEISALVSDTVCINSFKSELSEIVAKSVAHYGDFKILVPWGTLLGSELFSDKGMDLVIESSTYGFAVTDIQSTFESVGINQTIHRISVEVELTAAAYIGNYKMNETVKGNIPVTETVIVGKVPSSYYIRPTV